MAASLSSALDKDTDTRDDETLVGIAPASQATHIALYDEVNDLFYFGTVADVRSVLFPPNPANLSPVVTLNIAPNGIQVGQSAVFTATATDPDGVIVAGTFYIDGVPVAVLTSAPFTFTYTPTSANAVGTHQVKFTGLDNDGATGSATLPLVVIGAPVTAAPVPVLTFAPIGNKTVGDAPVQLSVTSTNTVTPISIVPSNGAAVALTQNGGVYTAAFPAAGTSTLTATQPAGNGYAAGSASQVVTVSAATTPTQRPTASLEISPERLASGGSTTMYVDARSTNSTVASVALYDDTTLITTLNTPPAAGQLWEYVYAPTTGGERQLTAVATDALGVSSLVSNTQTLTVAYNTPLSSTVPAGSPGQAEGIVFLPGSTQIFSFDRVLNTAGNTISLQITDSSDGSVNYIDFPDDYVGKKFAFQRSTGTTYFGSFPNANGTLNFTV